jgi:hypothetical protein
VGAVAVAVSVTVPPTLTSLGLAETDCQVAHEFSVVVTATDPVSAGTVEHCRLTDVRDV